jgi:O-antigen/teichoic acid export membrane protein
MHPAVTRVGASVDGRRELTTALRLTVGMTTAAIVAILFLKDLLVPLAYSRAFLPAAKLLPVQLFGDFFYFVGLPFTVYALGISRLRVYLAAWVGYALVSVIASFALMPALGLYGVPAGYGVSNAIGAAVAIVWLITRKEEGLLATLALIAAGLMIVGVEATLAWRGGHKIIEACLFGATVSTAAAWLWHARRPAS